jgi:hypothetical protein
MISSSQDSPILTSYSMAIVQFTTHEWMTLEYNKMKPMTSTAVWISVDQSAPSNAKKKTLWRFGDLFHFHGVF